MGEVDNFGAATVVVAPADWTDVIRRRRDAGARVFEMLTVIDQLDRGFDVVVALRDDRDGSQVLVTTTVSRDSAAVPSLVGVFAGADWYEREAYEMFGVTFEGHPGLTPLLLADGSPQFPLRKNEWLQRRVQTPWPGVKEPGESGEVDQLDAASEKPASGRAGRKARPLGVPAEDQR